MVKNSKHTLLLLSLLYSVSISAQSFNAVNRDMEITRITLENFLKKWDGDPLLNSIGKSDARHQKGEGVTFTVEAPNATILMNTSSATFRKGDNEIMDTFYTEKILTLQQERLTEAIKKFVVDFYSYMPELDNQEHFTVIFEIKDEELERNGKILPPTANASIRTYSFKVKWTMNDLKDLKIGKLKADQFSKRITTDK